MRLNKHISESGITSRREADAWIAAGRVTVNGAKAELGTQVKAGDEVLVDGRPLPARGKALYIALNKPRGITSTTERDVPGQHRRLRRPPRAHLPHRPARQGFRGAHPPHERRRHRQRDPARRARPREGIRRDRRAVRHRQLPVDDGEGRAHRRRENEALHRHAHRPRRIPHGADAGAQPADPPHVFRARLAREAARARSHHAHPPRRPARGPLARTDGHGSGAAPRYTCACQKAPKKPHRRHSRT